MIYNVIYVQQEESMRIKSWESPRKLNQRNDKSRLASARLRQLKKRNKRLRGELKKATTDNCHQ